MVPVRMFSWVSEDIGKGFPSKSLRVSIALAWDTVSTTTRQDLSGRVRKVTLPSVFGCIFEIGKCFLSMEHEPGYGSICSIGEDHRLDKGR